MVNIVVKKSRQYVITSTVQFIVAGYFASTMAILSFFYFASLASSSFRLSTSQFHAHPTSALFHFSNSSGLATRRATATHYGVHSLAVHMRRGATRMLGRTPTLSV